MMNRLLQFGRILKFLLFLFATVPANSEVRTTPEVGMIDAIVGADLRIERIGERLAAANVSLCRQTAILPGFVVQSLAAYGAEFRPAAIARMTFAVPLAVEDVVEGSPAAHAGIRRADGVIAIGKITMPTQLPGREQQPTMADIVAYRRALDSWVPGEALRLTLIRDGRQLGVDVPAQVGCASRFELLLGQGFVANADGVVIQIGAGFVAHLDDVSLAVVIAHELAHNILGHRSTMDRLKVKSGVGGEFGRSAMVQLAMEDEADRLSVRLLAQAGYDPHAPALFWRGEGRRIEGALPRGGSHRDWKSRAALLDQAASVYTLP